MKKNLAPQLIAILFLLFAFYPSNPYGYYILLRWICLFIFIFFIIKADDKDKQNWIWIFGVLAFIYNPIFPIHLNREIWSIINAITIIILIFSIFLF